MKKLIYRMTSLLLLLTTIGFSSWAQTCNKPKNLDVKLHNRVWYDAQVTWQTPDPDAQAFVSTDTLMVYNNGPYITSHGTGFQGANISTTSPSEQTKARSMHGHFGYVTMDDFTLTAKTALKYIDVYAMTAGGSYGLSDPRMTGASLGIYDDDPIANPSAKLIWGSVRDLNDSLGGKLMSVTFSGTYLTAPNETQSNREPIWKVRMKMDTTLPAGKYWVAFSVFPPVLGTTPCFIFARTPAGPIPGNSYSINGVPSTGSNNPLFVYDAVFDIYGIYQENAVKGYELRRNDSLIYAGNGAITNFYDKLPAEEKSYTYDLKALWLKDDCVSDSVFKTVHMEETPCNTPVSFREVTQDFEANPFPELDKCWQMFAVGHPPIIRITNHWDSAGLSVPEGFLFHGGKGALKYFTNNSYVGAMDTGFLYSPAFRSEGKKMIVSFWTYRFTLWPFAYDHILAYSVPYGTAIDSTIQPNLKVYKSTSKEPQTSFNKEGWYKHSFAIDGTNWSDTAYQLIFAFTAGGGGGSSTIFFDDVTIEEADLPEGSCETPTTPQVKYSEDKAQLVWGAPGAFEFNKGEIYHGLGGIESGMAPAPGLSKYNLTIASRFEPSDLKGLGIIEGTKLKSVSFVPGLKQTVDDFMVKIWQGGKVIEGLYSPGKEVYTQSFDKSAMETREWFEVELEVPVEIDPTKELWFGISCNVKAPGANGPFICDAVKQSRAFGKGNLLLSSDFQQWTTLEEMNVNFNINWCLKAKVEIPFVFAPIPIDPAAEVKEYTVYRDGVKLSTVNALAYTDHSIEAGKTDYQYAVSAHYNTGCNSPKIEAVLYQEPPTAIRGEEKGLTDAFRVYPNPANQQINITGENIRKVEVYNHIGQLVDVQTVSCNQIYTGSYKNGLYVLKITNAKGYTETKQIVILH